MRAVIVAIEQGSRTQLYTAVTPVFMPEITTHIKGCIL